MKQTHLFTIYLLALACITGCEGFETITGEQSKLGEVGTTITGTFNGASDVDLSVVSLDNGISTVEGSFNMTDPRYKKLIESHPRFFDVDGDKVRVHDVKFKVTTNGIENVSGDSDGIIIKYDSKEGDTYSNGRKVTHVSTDNDFNWRGMKIKVIQVENTSNKADGVKSVTYWGNHRFGIVAVETTFDDGSTDFASVFIQ